MVRIIHESWVQGVHEGEHLVLYNHSGLHGVICPYCNLLHVAVTLQPIELSIFTNSTPNPVNRLYCAAHPQRSAVELD
jgi:hypothetical protein